LRGRGRLRSRLGRGIAGLSLLGSICGVGGGMRRGSGWIRCWRRIWGWGGRSRVCVGGVAWGKNRTDPKFRKGGEIGSCPHFAVESSKSQKTRRAGFFLIRSGGRIGLGRIGTLGGWGRWRRGRRRIRCLWRVPGGGRRIGGGLCSRGSAFGRRGIAWSPPIL
jgi:hypothetical protein